MRIQLNGEVVPSEYQWLYDWFGIPAFSPAVVRQAIETNPDGEDLELEINSGGGSVFAGFEIYCVLREAKCNTVAIVQSLAASAASTAMVGCRLVLLSPVAQVMIHMPATETYGNQRAHRESLQMLESITQSILNGYQLRCGEKATRERLEELMNSETWLPAQDAVALGLADAITVGGEEVDAAAFPLSVVNAVGGGIRALAANAVHNDTGTLLAQYQQLVAAGVRPAAEGHPVKIQETPAPAAVPSTSNSVIPAGKSPAVSDDWRHKARLAIEKNRFL